MRRRRMLIAAGFGALALVGLSLLDPWLAASARSDDLVGLNNRDWYRVARVVGSGWLWAPVLIVIVLHDRGWSRGGLIAWSVVLAGLGAELFKRVLPRSRPFDEAGVLRTGYDWRAPMSGFWNDHALGMPSSHTAVAFAGCVALGCLMPRARWALIVLAGGCAVSRMLAGAHYATDVFVGALIGWGVAWAVCSRGVSVAPARVAR